MKRSRLPSAAEHKGYPVTPDGRYFVVRGRLWRCTNPTLTLDVKAQLVASLMHARRLKGIAMRQNDVIARESARKTIDEAKLKLGERGAVWWNDGAPDLNRHLLKNTIYSEWFLALSATLQASRKSVEANRESRDN